MTTINSPKNTVDLPRKTMSAKNGDKIGTKLRNFE